MSPLKVPRQCPLVLVKKDWSESKLFEEVRKYATFALLVARLTLRPETWGRYVSPKRHLTFTELHSVMSQKIEAFSKRRTFRYLR
jgi:hypothetical protein